MTELPILEGRWEGGDSYNEPASIDISIQGQGQFCGTFLYHNSELILSTSNFRSTGKKGTGTRLMMGAFALAKDCGVARAGADISSPAALRIRQKLFGEAMTFRDIGNNLTDLPITTNQAILSLQRISEFFKDPTGLYPTSELGFDVESDLTVLDTTDWERPAMHNRPPLAMRRILYQRGITLPLSLSQMRRRRSQA